MGLKPHFELMAEYNRWMNDSIFLSCATLGSRAFNKELGAFFGSLSGTLNHIMVADLIWLNRFALHPGKFPALTILKRFTVPDRLDIKLFEDLPELSDARTELDLAIVSCMEQATEQDFAQVLTYRDTGGSVFVKPFSALVQHFFNHQTHHRGQVTTLLSQQGIDPGVTDLNAIIPQIDNP